MKLNSNRFSLIPVTYLKLLVVFSYLMRELAHADYVYQVATTNKSYGVHSIVAEILDNLAINYAATAYPPNRLYQYLEQGKANIWTAHHENTIVRPFVDYGDEPFLCLKLSAFTIDGPAVPDIYSLQEKSIILIGGFSYLGWLDYFADPENAIKSYNASSRESAYLMLKEKRATYLLDYQIATLENINLMQFPGLKSYDLWTKPLYFVFSKNTPNLDALKSKVDNYLKGINQSKDKKCNNMVMP